MGKFIPVDPDRWAELVKAAGERDALVVEVRRLDAEVARLTDFKAKADQSEAKNARLKSEVARLTKAGEMSGNNLKRCYCQECENARKELYDRIAFKKGGQP